MEGGVAESNVIRPINKNVVHRICAGQVILDLTSAVKELVENSLDAGATSIEIALKEYGLESFQVIDNGFGVSPQNFKVLALKHHTSKLLDFPDLQSLTTFGFRGEALSSLCALGDLTVETRTINEVVATHLTYDRTGLLTAERKTARQVGTTVTVKKLFSNLPVRSKEFRRNIRKEYGKLISLLNAYALIAKGVRLVCTNTTGKNVRSVVLKTQGTGSLKENIITVFGTSTFSCLEPVTLSISDGCMVEGFISKSGYGSGRNIGDRQFFFVNGRPVDMPKVGKLVNELYRGANSRQYPVAIMNFSVPTRAYDVNVTPDKRKIFFSDENSILQSLREALEKIYSSNQASYSVNKIDELSDDKLASNIYSRHEGSQLPSEHLLPDNVLVNEERDDRRCADGGTTPTTAQEKIRDSFGEEMIQKSGACSVIHGFALRVHDNQKNNSPVSSDEQIMDLVSDKTGKHAPLQSRSAQKGSINSFNSLGHSSSIQMSLNKFVTVNKRKHESVETAISEIPLLRSGPPVDILRDYSSPKRSAPTRSPDNTIEVDVPNKMKSIEPQQSKSTIDHVFGEADTSILFPCGNGDTEKIKTSEQKSKDRVLDSDSVVTASIGKDFQLGAHDLPDVPIPVQSSGASTGSPVVSSGSKVGFSLQFSFKDLISRRKQRLSRLQSSSRTSGRINLKGGFAAASLELSQGVNEEGKARALAAATSELERLFKKEDFKQMKVIGQFNLGFIIGKLDQDLFIVDQHAADEKYNYERLSQTTVLNQQPLLRPLKLEVSPEEEIVISMHMDTFRKNGFLLEEDMHAPSGQRFILKAVPFSKNITFGIADVKELISILSDSHGECSMIGSYRSDTADSVCPPKVRAMLASRACRSSIMIGDSLGRNEMQKILEHLAVLKSPWNCPHGRPTMRHLVDLRTVHRSTDEEEEAIKSRTGLRTASSPLFLSLTRWKPYSTAGEMLPLSLLKTAQGHPMLVELKNGETYNGHLVNCDTWMNIHLREVICTSKDGDRFWRMPECYIRGNTIKYLRVPDEVIDKVQEETKSRSDRKPPGVGRGRGRGREDGSKAKGVGRGMEEGGARGGGRGRGGSGGRASGNRGGGRGR
ncbi:DNA mismatch repair protein PMS1 [Sesamum alatum]|uniref:DNA mismatch repair protein PMS1 n=1 Tax=Sesamum alatum TaxID=300844 RepID=A0AAE2CDH8_9LAMI|nr:DNA mismatch repair protein PMS1 [Sesamum alatum]